MGLRRRPRAVASALLPMGGAVSGVAGPNWMLIGDAAACVNPLNGEGIDYGLETGRLAAELLGCGDLSQRGRRCCTPLRPTASRLRADCVAADLPWFLPRPAPLAMRSVPDGHRCSGDGQPRYRRGHRLDRADLATRRAGVSPDGSAGRRSADRVSRPAA